MTRARRDYDTGVSGDTERLVRAFCAWWETRGHDATTAEGERIAHELLNAKGTGLSQRDVDAYCAKLKRGFAGGRTILAASEVGEALVEWLASSPDAGAGAHVEPEANRHEQGRDDPPPPAGDDPLDEISWSEGTGDALLAGVNVDDLPPIPDDLPPLDDAPPLAAPDMAFEMSSLDDRVDAIGGRDVFAASDPPPEDTDLQLDLDAEMIGKGDKAHYVREEEMEVGGREAGLNVDVDPDAPNARTADVLDLGAVDAGFEGDVDVPESLSAGVPGSRASAAPVGRVTSSAPPPDEPFEPGDEDTREDLPALTTPPPAPRSPSQPLVIGLVVVVLVAAAAAATFAL